MRQYCRWTSVLMLSGLPFLSLLSGCRKDTPDEAVRVVWLTDATSLQSSIAAIERSLERASEEGQVRYRRVDVPAGDESAAIDAAMTTATVDAVLAPRRLRASVEAIDPTLAVFELEWLFGREGDGDIPGFVQIPGADPGFVTSEGDFGNFPSDWGWGGPAEILADLNQLVNEGVEGGGVTGGRVANVGVVVTVVGTAISLAYEGLKAMYRQMVEQAERIEQMERIAEELEAMEQVLKERLQEAGGDSGDGLDDDGIDALLLLNEIAQQLEADELWESIVQGTTPPESTDVRDDFVTFLQELQVTETSFVDAVRDERPVPEGVDDSIRTAFGLLYWLWTEANKSVAERSAVLDYLWSQGAPIDPPERAANAGRLYLGGSLMMSGDGPRLELTFMR